MTAVDTLARLREDGPLLRAADAVRQCGLPRMNASTVTRWCLKGVGGRRLEAVRIGGVWHSTTQAVERFVAAQQPEEPDPPPDERTAAARRQAEARRALRARGLTVGGPKPRGRS